MTIRLFVSQLEEHRSQIATTTSPISDDDLRLRLLNSLPAGEGWRTVKFFSLRDNSTLEQTITVLESNEGPLLQRPSAEVVEYAYKTRGPGKTEKQRSDERVKKEKKK